MLMATEGTFKMVSYIHIFHVNANKSDFPSTGRFRILCFTSTDLLTPSGTSATSLNDTSKILSSFPAGVIELVVVHPLEPNTFVWKEIPEIVKTAAEMRFYNGTELQDAYETYGLGREKGAIAVVRPDGYIGTIAELKDTEKIKTYLKGCLREVEGKSSGVH
jgi:phenol 2-monooxygenase